MHKIILVLFVGLFSLYPLINVRCQIKNKISGFIEYDISQKLKWDDFNESKSIQLEPAVAYIQISYDIIEEEEGLSVFASCAFNKGKSFVGVNHKNDFLLNHQQRHFDIAYLFVSKFCNIINEENINIDNVDSLYNKIIKEWKAYDKKYDAETKHARSQFDQNLWNKKIEDELNQLKSAISEAD